MIILLILNSVLISYSDSRDYPCGASTGTPINYNCSGPQAIITSLPSACEKDKSDIKATMNAICEQKFNDARKEVRKEILEECREFSKEIREVCGTLKFTKKCTEQLKACANSDGKGKVKACSNISDKIDAEAARDALDDAKDDFEDSEDKMQDLQETLKTAREDALEKKQSTEEKIAELETKLAEVPVRAQELALKSETERDKTLLTHIDNMNKITDEIQAISDAIHDAETQLTNKRNELLSQCELEARGKQQAKISEKNQKKSVGRNTVSSLSDAIQTSYQTTADGKKVLRNTKEIIARFERCQKTRMHQTGIQAAERTYQRNLIALESKRKSIEKQTNALSARLESSLKTNSKIAELEMASLAREQASMQQEALRLQKQLMENNQQSEANIAQLEQSIQKAQFDQYQKQQTLFSAISMSNLSKQQGGLDKEEVEKINSSLGYFMTRKDDDELGGIGSTGLYCTDAEMREKEINSRLGTDDDGSQ